MIASDDIAPQLRRVIRDCRKLYTHCARQLGRRHKHLIGQSTAEFTEVMDDLHRGLLIKVYTEVIRSDNRWSRMEKFAGSLLIDHLFNERLQGTALREAAEGLIKHADELTWDVLVGPFNRYRPLANHKAHIETIVMRFANLIAKCDGLTSPEEEQTLKRIQHEVDAALYKSDGPNDLTTVENEARQVASVPGRRQSQQQNDEQAPVAEVVEDAKSPEEKLAEAMTSLQKLIGLEEVKQRVESLTNFLRLQREREQAGLPSMPISLHMAFVGNPGTGKTTVARIVGQILGGMGVLQSGHLVETDRAGLVAEYAGQTAVKTNQICDTALDGVLFIDEAYSLVDRDGDDAFGREAIQTLLKRMEDDRKRLVVIVAGYPDEMDQMIRSNPGLSSRINHRLEFTDYRPADLGRIFELLCRENHYELPAASRHRLLCGLDALHRRRDRHFGNGRLSRNAFEDTVRKLADRISTIVPLTHELLTTLTPEDIALPGLDHDQLETHCNRPHHLRIACPRCDKRLRTKGRLLGKKTRCPDCQHVFTSDWAELEAVDAPTG